VISTREEVISYFTKKEEEFANLLIEIGITKNIAKALVFLANTREATSRSISWEVASGIFAKNTSTFAIFLLVPILMRRFANSSSFSVK